MTEHLQSVDDLVPVILRNDQGDRDAFLRGRDQLGRGHQEGPVTEKGGDPGVRIRMGQPHTHRGRDLVTHAGEPELEVAGAAVGGVPHLLQVSGRPAGGRDHDVAGTGMLLHDPDDLTLGQDRVGGGDDVRSRVDRRLVEQLVGVQRVGALDLPRGGELLRPGLPAGTGCQTVRLEQVGECGQRPLGVADDAGGPEPVGVAHVDVDAGELHLGVGEDGVGAGGEVGQPGADRQHQVRFGGEGVRGGGAL